VAQGQKIITAGDRLTAQRIALLASQGVKTVTVGGSVRAAIISTGDELAAAGEPLQEGQIYDSNSALLQALLLSAGSR
jgi:molybdopterin molybdotransferase